MVSKHVARWLAGIVAIAMILSATPLVAESKSAPSKVEPALFAAATSRPDAIFSVIIRGAKRLPTEPKSAGRSDDLGVRVAHAEAVLKGLGATAGRSLGIIGSVAGPLRGKQILELSRSGLIERIVWDERFAVSWTASDAAAAATSSGIQAVNAPQAWSQTGASGRGIGVAILDSGVADHPDLAGRVVARVDLTGEGSTGDPGGHGTHVAGLIAGDGTASNGAFTGIAPQANIVSVRVIDANGYAKLSTIFAGMQWILGHQTAYNIRVVNMSFGGTVRSSYADDLLASAAELLNFAGMVTVVSAGNAGPGPSTITSPGNDPFVVTVGAADDAGTATLADDGVALWSSRGPTAFDAIAKPDLIAPGRHMVSLRVPGSTLDLLLPDRQVTAPGALTPSYFMMSGTSMSAPIVAGIAALYVELHPAARPRAVKAQLMGTAHALPGVAATDQGSGVVDALAAVTTNPVPMSFTRYPASRAFADQMFAKLKGQPIVWRDLTFNGGVDSHGITWEGITWENITWDAITWENITWEGFTWEAISFADITLTGITWESVTWEGITWETSSPANLAVQ